LCLVVRSTFFYASLLVLRLPPISSLFPYTTLFRSYFFFTRSNSCLITDSSFFSLFKIAISSFDFLCNSSCSFSNDKISVLEKERSEEHTSELQSRFDLVCRLLLEKKKQINTTQLIY